MSASTASASAMTTSGVTFSSGSSYSACMAVWSVLSVAKTMKTPAAFAASHMHQCQSQGRAASAAVQGMSVLVMERQDIQMVSGTPTTFSK